ncbi:MAG: cation:proton antiporter regulatory subunit [Bacteroidia bacterium]
MVSAKKADGIVVCLARNGKRILNPDSNVAFEAGDIVWIVGYKKKIARLDATSAE